MYAIVLKWPANNTLSLGAPVTTEQSTVAMLGSGEKFAWKPRSGGGLDITFPPMSPIQLPSQYAWTVKLENLKE